MAENAVEDDGYTLFLRAFAQADEILLGAEQRIDLRIVGGIVAVI